MNAMIKANRNVGKRLQFHVVSYMDELSMKKLPVINGMLDSSTGILKSDEFTAKALDLKAIITNFIKKKCVDK